jgi:hypothetical protein
VLAEKDETTGLWHYADRPLFVDVWTAEKLESRIADPEYADLPFGFTEEWRRPPSRFVFPKCYQPHAQPLLDYLRSHYSEYSALPEVSSKFWVFDLTRQLH